MVHTVSWCWCSFQSLWDLSISRTKQLKNVKAAASHQYSSNRLTAMLMTIIEFASGLDKEISFPYWNKWLTKKSEILKRRKRLEDPKSNMFCLLLGLTWSPTGSNHKRSKPESCSSTVGSVIDSRRSGASSGWVWVHFFYSRTGCLQ